MKTIIKVNKNGLFARGSYAKNLLKFSRLFCKIYQDDNRKRQENFISVESIN